MNLLLNISIFVIGFFAIALLVIVSKLSIEVGIFASIDEIIDIVKDEEEAEKLVLDSRNDIFKKIDSVSLVALTLYVAGFIFFRHITVLALAVVLLLLLVYIIIRYTKPRSRIKN